MSTNVHNPNAWEPVIASKVSTPAIRDTLTDSMRAAQYVEIAKQFEVETNPRYVKGHNNDPKDGNETYCNIFQCDVILALGIVLPHWMDPATGAPVPMGKGKETSANGVCTWMALHAFEYGWMECGEQQARARATRGYPTIVVWNNPGGIGHVGVVLPGVDFTHLAQAGGTNFFDRPLQSGFGGVKPLRFYTHD